MTTPLMRQLNAAALQRTRPAQDISSVQNRFVNADNARKLLQRYNATARMRLTLSDMMVEIQRQWTRFDPLGGINHIKYRDADDLLAQLNEYTLKQLRDLDPIKYFHYQRHVQKARLYMEENQGGLEDNADTRAFFELTNNRVQKPLQRRGPIRFLQ